jgi:hypothetical protein
MPTMSKREKIARLICQDRGNAPDAPLTRTLPPVDLGNGLTEQPAPMRVDQGWKAYADLADKIIKLK